MTDTQMPEEIWKPIPEYEGYYEVSDMGRVRSLKRIIFRGNGRRQSIPEIILNPLMRDGRKSYCLRKDGKIRKINAARLVGVAFLGAGKHQQVNHIDGNKTNDVLSNLECVSPRENINHYHSKRGLLPTGVLKTKGGYTAKMTINGEYCYLGFFKTPIEAHEAYLRKVQELGEGKYAKSKAAKKWRGDENQK